MRQMQVPADLRRAILTGVIITVGSVLASFVPVYIWLQLDPVIDVTSIYISCIVLPAIIAPSCSYFILRAQMKAERLAHENHRLANVDELTDLPNRRAFFTAASALQAQAGGGFVYCAIADIDNFKLVNDEFGHEAGDAVLKSVGRVLSAWAPPGGLVARLGGEEFAIAGVFADEAEARASFAAAVRAVGETDCVHGGVRLSVTVSLGFSAGTAGETVSALLSRADHALYRAKHSGKNRAQSFADDPRRRGPQPMRA